MKVQAFVGLMIADTVLFFNVGKMMNANQVGATANMIIEEYYYLKPDDFKLCFNRAKKGYYGKVYDRIDGQVIFDWLNAYSSERLSQAETIQIQEHARHKHDPYKRTSETRALAEHAAKLFAFEREYKK